MSMNYLFLLDVRPDPVPVAGVGGLILLVFVVLMFAAAMIVGFVFLLKRLRRGSSPTPESPAEHLSWDGAVREGSTSTGRTAEFQPSNPNQP
jgi:flagellar basal body-associated protein FliL